MKLDTSTQVKLVREGKTQVAWIPTDAAVQGYEVELKEDDLFWTVAEVFNFTVQTEVVRGRERDYISHRKATDV